MWQKSILILFVSLFCAVLFGCGIMGESKQETADAGAVGEPVKPESHVQDEIVDLSTEPRIALVIANGAYKHVPYLPNSTNDAELMAQTLRVLGFKLIGDKPLLNADKYAMESAIREFGKAITGKAVGLFYYSGHGIQWHGQNYLVPVTADVAGERDVKYELVDANFVTQEMGTAGNRLNLVILDACRNNPFGSRGFKGAGDGLAAMEATAGTVLAFATQPGSKALAGKGRYSPYTEALATTIKQPGLGLFETLNAVGVSVEQATSGQQQPWFNASPIKGNFYFARSFNVIGDKTPKPSALPLPPPLENKFSLSDLANQERITKAQWNKWQAKMQADFAQSAAFQGGMVFQRTAWVRFLTTYRENNPYSEKDEQLRAEAAKRRDAIKDHPIVTPPDIATIPPVHNTTTTPVVPKELPTTKIVVPIVPTIEIGPVAGVRIDTLTPQLEMSVPTVTAVPTKPVVAKQKEQNQVQPKTTIPIATVVAPPPTVTKLVNAKAPIAKDQAKVPSVAEVMEPKNSEVVVPKDKEDKSSNNDANVPNATR